MADDDLVPADGELHLVDERAGLAEAPAAAARVLAATSGSIGQSPGVTTSATLMPSIPSS